MKGVSTSPLSQRGRALRDCNCVGAKFVILTKQCRGHYTALKGGRSCFLSEVQLTGLTSGTTGLSLHSLNELRDDPFPVIQILSGDNHT